jgi:hypothetical protein
VASAYVIDKKANQFWICTARYQLQDLTANNGECVKLPADIGRPSLTDAYEVHPVTGSFCAIRHAGLCVRVNLP